MWLPLKPKRDGTNWECEEKKIIVPIHSNLTRNREFQKNSKKIEKIKKHQYGFFSSQNGTGEVENERKRKFSSWTIPTGPERGNSRKIEKKLKKIIKRHWGFFSSQNKTGQVENECKKVFSFRSIQPQPGIGNYKKIAKEIQKMKKNHYGFFSSQNGTGKTENEIKKKYSRSDPFQHDPE